MGKKLIFWIGGNAFVPDGVRRAVEKLKAMRASKVSQATPAVPDRKDARAA